MKKMERNIALSREQMKELAYLGVDISDASMCWVQEPNEKNFRMVVHDEYCYEMGCLNPVPAYSFEDIVIKLKGEIHYFYPEVFDVFPEQEEEPWYFSVHPYVNEHLPKEINTTGSSPLEAAFMALCEAQEIAPKSISMLPSPVAIINEVNNYGF